MKLTKEQALAWQRGHLEASERSWELRVANRPSAAVCFDRVNSMLGLMADVITSPANAAARKKEAEVARARWIELRKKFAARSA